MSLLNWKLLAQIKTYFGKLNDKSINHAINKEFAQLLQKIQPAVYDSDAKRSFESQADSKEVDKKDLNGESKETKSEEKVEESSYMIPNLIQGFRIKMGGKEEKTVKDVSPKWKSETIVSKVWICLL